MSGALQPPPPRLYAAGHSSYRRFRSARAEGRLPGVRQITRAAAAFVLVSVVVSGCGASPAEQPLTGVIAFSGALSGNDNFSDVFVVGADGMHRKRLTRLSGAEFDPSWSPDGARLVYRDSRRGINENDEIYVMSADGSRRRNLSRSPANDWSPAWSPDGKFIVFSSERSGSLDIWRMRPDGSGQLRLTVRGRDEYPTWSPDSKLIAFMRLGDIWTIRSDGSAARALATTVDEEGWPAWSPKGHEIAYVVGYEGARTIWLMDSDGTNAHALTQPGHDDMGPAWSPDGTHLVFSRDGTMMVMRGDGHEIRGLGIDGSLPDWTVTR